MDRNQHWPDAPLMPPRVMPEAGPVVRGPSPPKPTRLAAEEAAVEQTIREVETVEAIAKHQARPLKRFAFESEFIKEVQISNCCY